MSGLRLGGQEGGDRCEVARAYGRADRKEASPWRRFSRGGGPVVQLRLARRGGNCEGFCFLFLCLAVIGFRASVHGYSGMVD